MGARREGGQFLNISAKCIARTLGGQLVDLSALSRLAPFSCYRRMRIIQMNNHENAVKACSNRRSILGLDGREETAGNPRRFAFR